MATIVKCECGLYLIEDNMNKHRTSNTHRDVIEHKSRKLNNYNAVKDSFNCCLTLPMSDTAASPSPCSDSPSAQRQSN